MVRASDGMFEVRHQFEQTTMRLFSSLEASQETKSLPCRAAKAENIGRIDFSLMMPTLMLNVPLPLYSRRKEES